MAQHAPNLVDGATLALICGVASSTIPHWRRSGMPVEKVGSRGQAWGYDTAKVIKWLVERQTSAAEQEAFDLNVERARLAHHQANKTALEEGLLAGEIVKTEDVLMTWQAMVAAARAKLLAMPGKLAAKVFHAETVKEAEEEAERLVHEAAEELGSSGLPARLERALGPDLPRLEAAAKANSQ